jgi:SNF2 family DNA or RNA helicase
MTLPAAGVFNEQRTGKTPTSIMTMQQKGVERLLIVCPASMLYKWAEEYKTWTDKPVFVISSASKFNSKDFTWKLNMSCIVINYENLRDNGSRTGCYKKLLREYKPDGLIVDEVHRCKDRKSANFKAVGGFRHVPNRLYLSGTPAPNKQWDIWTTLNLIAPNIYTSYWNFIHEYFEEQTIWVGGRSITQPATFKLGMKSVLQQELNAISVMRKRKDVMPWLPKEEAPTVIRLPCTPAQSKYIKDLEETFETEHINTQSVLEQLVRIRQICAAPKILNLKGNSPKIDWLQQYILDYPNKSIIIFSNSKKFIELVQCVVKCCVITGDTTTVARQQHIVLFQKGTTSVLVIQTQAGKEGLTLDHADVTIFLDTYPPAADYLQAKDRMVPVIPEHVKPQEIIHLMMKDTYDERLYNLVAQGIKDTDIINDYIKYIHERRNTNG